MSFQFHEDFSKTDSLMNPYWIIIEKNSRFSHGHGRVMEDGKYCILLNGCKHFLNTPYVRDFKLKTQFSQKMHDMNWGYGFQFWFRYNRETRTGRHLRCEWFPKENDVFRLILDGETVAERQLAKPFNFADVNLEFEVTGEKGVISFNGNRFEFTCPDRPGYPEKGLVGCDLIFSPSASAEFSFVDFESPDTLEKVRAGKPVRFHISGVQGCNENGPTLDLDVWKYEDGTAELEMTMGGTIRDRAKPENAGGGGWCYEIDILKDPYLRLESEGKLFRNLILYPGDLFLMDRNEGRLVGKLKPYIEWPMKLRFLLRDFPSEFTAAFGYKHMLHGPWVMAENGPWEMIRSSNDELLYEGPSLLSPNVGVKIESPADKLLVSRIPKGIPDYDRALRHAKEQHYFYDDEPVNLTVKAFYRLSDYRKSELQAECSLEDVFENAVPGVTLNMERISCEHAFDVFGWEAWKITLNKCLPSGVYHLKYKVMAGYEVVADDCEIFEVLPEDEDAPPPPIASGLPMMLAMPNEIVNLQADAFDPYGQFGGCGHYYTLMMRYPVYGRKLRVWELLKVYHRKWFLMLQNRNTDVLGVEPNADLIAHADYIDCEEPRYRFRTPQYIWSQNYHQDFLLEMLLDFMAQKKRGFKILTEDIVRSHLEKQEHLSTEEFHDLFDTAWEEWIEFHREETAKQVRSHLEKILAINPKAAQGSYGPLAIYTDTYKSAYTLRLGRNGMNSIPETIRNGSFFFLEDYHYSCDYKMTTPSFFLANYKLTHPDDRKLFPEVYFSGRCGCDDGAVYQAHPPYGFYTVPPDRMRKLVYTFIYGTPYRLNGTFRWWEDAGFHMGAAERSNFKHFLHAWGNYRRHRPVKPVRAPFSLFDFDLFKRHGDYFEDEYNLKIPGCELTDVGNTSEESMVYSWRETIHAGYPAPIQGLIADLDSLTPEMTPFLFLPALDKGTPEKIISAIRRAHERGIGLVCFEAVDGLEDLFGVKCAGKARHVKAVPGESFQHKQAMAHYIADGADVILSGAEEVYQPMDIPVVMTHRTKWGRTAFFNIAPSLVLRESERSFYQQGKESLSVTMKQAFRQVLAYMDPQPVVQSEYGYVTGCYDADGALIVTTSDDSPIYQNTTVFPKKFRFKVQLPGIENAVVESDSPWNVAEKGPGYMVLRTETPKDGAQFFVFKQK